MKNCSWSDSLYALQFSWCWNANTQLKLSTWLFVCYGFEFVTCFEITFYYLPRASKSLQQCHWVFKEVVRSEAQVQLKKLSFSKPLLPLESENKFSYSQEDLPWERLMLVSSVNPQWVTTTFYSFRTNSQRKMWLAGCWHRWIQVPGILSGNRENISLSQPLTWSNHRWPIILHTHL